MYVRAGLSTFVKAKFEKLPNKYSETYHKFIGEDMRNVPRKSAKSRFCEGLK